jgi:uncharacterized protein YgiM (DUF1202 family)
MKRHKTLYAALLTVAALVFMVFVVIMQGRFSNPEFADLPAPPEQTGEEEQAQDEEEEADIEETGALAGAAGSVVNEADEEAEEEETNQDTEEESEPSYSTRTVTAETLNARSGPGTEYEITGLLVLDQVVEVEDTGGEWVKVITDEFEGYVNERYLSEE